MKQYKFDVVIIGAGPAGVTAAGCLAGSGISVAMIETGVYAGAENWSGCVYFAESLAEPDCFGSAAVLSAPFERRVVRRGTLLHNGLDVVGVELTDASAYRNCYTVLRPVYDPYFANLARAKGAALFTETTVLSLIRKENRVIGVQTDRGPLFADLVFIAEGDASHLVRSEGLEQVPNPHYLQGVKAVLSLAPDEIEKRFRLQPGEAAAYELLIRNAAIAGRTAKLNIGGFLYTNQNSLSVGYVAPLDNIRNNYRGSHDTLFAWMKGLPYIKELTEGATLSSYGTKIIRSGGWKERPVLVEDGLAVGGASVGLGVDIPFPNFTGPASATGLYFARAARSLLNHGRDVSAKNLAQEYLSPLRYSVYGRNAQHLSRWPGYFGRSKVLFSRTVDLACGTAHFLSSRDLVETGRFLRPHVLSFRALKEFISDKVTAIGSLNLWKPLILNAINPALLGAWFANLVKPVSSHPSGLKIILRINNRDVDPASLPSPVRGLIKRISPALMDALKIVYANDTLPAEHKLSKALKRMMRSLSILDILLFPFFILSLLMLSLGTAVWDAFRYYVLKTNVTDLLQEPVMLYNESLRTTRDLDAVKPATTLDAKLATNTYRIGTTSHIRTLWPENVKDHAEMSQAGLWWVCPARVYVYDAPLFGRGKVTVNYENCIKCESCWRSDPSHTLWGRHTDHKLIYRPESSAIPLLLESLKAKTASVAIKLPTRVDEFLWYPGNDLAHAAQSALQASRALQDAITKLPAAVSSGRKTWPLALGRRLVEKLAKLETLLSNDRRPVQANMIQRERKALELGLGQGRFFAARYQCQQIERCITSWRIPSVVSQEKPVSLTADVHLSYAKLSQLFPDRVVKQWEDAPLPMAEAEKLWSFISEHQSKPVEVVRALSAINPALGLIAAHQLHARNVLSRIGITLGHGIVAISGDHLDIKESIDSVHIQGTLSLAPCAAANTLLILANQRGHVVSLSAPGVTLAPSPAIGFRAAGLTDIALNCTIKKLPIIVPASRTVPDAASFLAIALGAADYLCTRVKEHALGRIQFPGQMLDTGGRDGIAKIGAVKALIARTESWRLLLETLYQASFHAELRTPNSEPVFNLLCATVAAASFSPEPGTMGYDAGQVFGGFAYSEDDLLSRFYRDSALFRFLAPGYKAAAEFHAAIAGDLALHPAGGLPAPSEDPLGPLVARLQGLMKECTALPRNADKALVGEAEAIALGIPYLLRSINAGLLQGETAEGEAAAVEVLLKLGEAAAHRAELSAGRGRVPIRAVFPIEPVGTRGELDLDYDSFCSAPGTPHKSGSFLLNAFDRQPRFVPEMQLHDAKLRSRWEELVGWFKQNCRNAKFDNRDLERYIDKVHRLPDNVIQTVRKNRWLATYVPKSLDGLGWHKAEYYILNSVAGSFGDASIDLLIMASTSIGTTPILLGLDDELPRVREELSPLMQNERILGEIDVRLAAIITSFSHPDPSFIRKEYEAIMKLVDERIRRTRVVKYLAANFLQAFYGAGIAGKRGDFSAFMSNLKRAGELFPGLMQDVRAALDELPRREQCHKLFLRYLGHGAISAFALTEPTAGSDSGGVQTTAKSHIAKLTLLNDGRYSFSPGDDAGEELRYLIDASRITFTDEGIAYLTPDNAIARIKFDKYDYATDQGIRYYLYQGKECLFHDIGQVRTTEHGMAYHFYSLTGAKMWITNGSIATQFCLYARTPEGVTGFMVDRHAEGLKVGADEKKTGQRGSPTNEISIDRVRVPYEAVIGYEGHGQVNALETLNVGRCGLAVVSGALMRKLLQEAEATIAPSPERDSLLGEAAAVLFGSESLAYYLVGLFDRPHESVRMESAIAKYVCSEDIHEFISLIEQAYGPEGQTEKHFLEKARRDSRILTIYEGTNEVQRFLILKDLVAQAAGWPELPVQQNDADAQELVIWKNKLRTLVMDATAVLGDACWSDAMLQPALFPLAELAGEILRLECILYRKAWLHSHSSLLATSSEEYVRAMLLGAERAHERTVSRLRHSEQSYASHGNIIVRGMDMPEVLVADTAFERMHAVNSSFNETKRLPAPVRILSIVRPVADLSPAPRLSNGNIEELIWKLDPRDQAGLAQAITLKAGNRAQVTLDVLMPGLPGHEQLLRTSTGAAVDRLIRLNIAYAAPVVIAEAIRSVEVMQPYDIIMVGRESLNSDAGVNAFLAGSLKRALVGTERIDVRPGHAGLEHIDQPSIVCITARTISVATTLAEQIEAAASPVLVREPIAAFPDRAPRFEIPQAAVVTAKIVTSAPDAAEHIKRYAAAESSAASADYIEDLSCSSLQVDPAVWALLDPVELKSNSAVLCAARLLADSQNRRLHALIPAPGGRWPSLLGAAHANGADRAFCMDTGHDMLSTRGKQETLRLILQTSGTPFIVADASWIEPLGFIAGEASRSGSTITLVNGVTAITQLATGSLVLSQPAYDDRLVRRTPLAQDGAFITVARNAEFPTSAAREGFRAAALDVVPDSAWLAALPTIAGPTLSQADVIIDLGYGIRDQAGLDLAHQLKSALESLGLSPLFGATRKVTQDLKLQPLDAQIGQTGVRVNPKIIIALGISGAPQHIDYLGARADIFCFNKDPDAALMKLGQSRRAPRVHPIPGDLFVTVKELIRKLS